MTLDVKHTLRFYGRKKMSLENAYGNIVNGNGLGKPKTGVSDEAYEKIVNGNGSQQQKKMTLDEAYEQLTAQSLAPPKPYQGCRGSPDAAGGEVGHGG